MDVVYEKLRERLDKFPDGYPATNSGIELKILEGLFTPEEAELALMLKPTPERSYDLSKRINQDEKHVASTLDAMWHKGLIMRWSISEQQFLYWLIPFPLGFVDFQRNTMTHQLAEQLDEYQDDMVAHYLRDVKMPRYRFIPVSQKVSAEGEVQPYEQIKQIIESKNKFAVGECMCKKTNRMLDKPCNKPHEVCMAFGPAATVNIELGICREISKQEAMAILQEAEEQGLVHMTSNYLGSYFMCNCCNCCCPYLKAIANHGVREAFAKSSYYASKDMSLCTTCKTCMDRCQIKAIQMDNGHTVIKRELCIGCGLCASTCPSGSIRMIKKIESETSPIYANELEMMQAMGKAKGKVFPFD